ARPGRPPAGRRHRRPRGRRRHREVPRESQAARGAVPRRGDGDSHRPRLERGRPSDRARLAGGHRGAAAPGPAVQRLLMAPLRHLLKRGDTALALEMIEHQAAAGDLVTVALLPGATATPPPGLPTRRDPNELSWNDLLEEIFEADQVIAW